MSSNSIILKFASFSTNVENYASISLIRQFFISCNCKNISYAKEGHVEFEYQLSNKINCHIHFFEIQKLDKIYTICSVADGYFIFIDLDNHESSSIKIDKILSYIKDTCNMEKKFSIIGLYKEHYKIDDTMNKEAINDYLRQHLTNYSYNELNQDNSNDLVKILTSAFEEISETKSVINQHSKQSKKTIEFDEDNSNSTCIIV